MKREWRLIELLVSGKSRLRIIPVPFYKHTREIDEFKLCSVQQKTLKKFQTLRLRAHSVYSLGWYNSNAQIIRSVSPLHSGCWEHFAKAHVCNPVLGFWSKKLPEAVVIYIFFERKFLVCYWASNETISVIEGHKICFETRNTCHVMRYVKTIFQ